MGIAVYTFSGNGSDSVAALADNVITDAGVALHVYDDGAGDGVVPVVTMSGDSLAVSAGGKFIANQAPNAIDATSVNFGAYDKASLDDDYAIEDRVDHALDAAGLGLVTWVAANVYVTAQTAGVQRGIDVASDRDIVNVAPGTYYESIAITRPLTVVGTAGSGATFLDGSSATGNFYMVRVNASDVTVSGFDISNHLYAGTADASGIAVYPTGSPLANVRLTNNVIHDIGLMNRTGAAFGTYGINVGPIDGLEVDHNTIYNIGNSDPRASAVGILTWGNGAADPADNINIHDDTVHDVVGSGTWAVGICPGFDTANATVVDNHVTGNVKQGIDVVSPAAGLVTIRGNDVTGATKAGVVVDAGTAKIENNDLRGNAVGILVQNGALVDAGGGCWVPGLRVERRQQRPYRLHRRHHRRQLCHQNLNTVAGGQPDVMARETILAPTSIRQ